MGINLLNNQETQIEKKLNNSFHGGTVHFLAGKIVNDVIGELTHLRIRYDSTVACDQLFLEFKNCYINNYLDRTDLFEYLKKYHFDLSIYPLLDIIEPLAINRCLLNHYEFGAYGFIMNINLFYSDGFYIGEYYVGKGIVQG